MLTYRIGPYSLQRVVVNRARNGVISRRLDGEHRHSRVYYGSLRVDKQRSDFYNVILASTRYGDYFKPFFTRGKFEFKGDFARLLVRCGFAVHLNVRRSRAAVRNPLFSVIITPSVSRIVVIGRHSVSGFIVIESRYRFGRAVRSSPHINRKSGYTHAERKRSVEQVVLDRSTLKAVYGVACAVFVKVGYVCRLEITAFVRLGKTYIRIIRIDYGKNAVSFLVAVSVRRRAGVLLFVGNLYRVRRGSARSYARISVSGLRNVVLRRTFRRGAFAGIAAEFNGVYSRTHKRTGLIGYFNINVNVLIREYITLAGYVRGTFADVQFERIVIGLRIRRNRRKRKQFILFRVGVGICKRQEYALYHRIGNILSYVISAGIVARFADGGELRSVGFIRTALRADTDLNILRRRVGEYYPRSLSVIQYITARARVSRGQRVVRFIVYRLARRVIVVRHILISVIHFERT